MLFATMPFGAVVHVGGMLPPLPPLPLAPSVLAVFVATSSTGEVPTNALGTRVAAERAAAGAAVTLHRRWGKPALTVPLPMPPKPRAPPC